MCKYLVFFQISCFFEYLLLLIFLFHNLTFEHDIDVDDSRGIYVVDKSLRTVGYYTLNFDKNFSNYTFYSDRHSLNRNLAGLSYYPNDQHSNKTIKYIFRNSDVTRQHKQKCNFGEIAIVISFLGLVFIRSLKILYKRNIIFMFYLGIIKITLTKLKSDISEINSLDSLKNCSKLTFFTIESIEVMDKIINFYQYTSCVNLFLLKVRSNNCPNFLWLVLLLSGDIEKNPGPITDTLSNKGLNFVHININSLLPKIDEMRNFVKKQSIAVLGVTESKLDSSINDSELKIEGYELLRCDRNRHGGGVACYISKSLCFNIKNIFSEEIENIFIDILLPKTKPFT